MGTTPNWKRITKPIPPQGTFGALGSNIRPGVPGPLREKAAVHRSLLIREFSLFSNVGPREADEILAAARKRELPRGQTIHFEGDPVQQIVLLTSGSAKIVQFGQNGSAVILRLCGPGELVGTLGLSTHGRHCATALTLRVSEALVWDTSVFECLSHRIPSLRLNTALIIGKQLRDMEDRFREISTERVAARLSRQIIRLMNQVGQRESDAVEINISREELAQLIGTTLFTVSRLLSEWDKRGIVKTRREAVLILNAKALEDLSEAVGQLPLKR